MKENKERKTLNEIVREKQGYRTTSITEKNPRLSPITRTELKEMLVQDGWKELPTTEDFFRVGEIEQEENYTSFKTSWFHMEQYPFGLEELDYEVIHEILEDLDWEHFTGLYPNINPVEFSDEFNLSIKYYTYEREGVRISFIINSGNREEDSTYHLIYFDNGKDNPCNWNVLSGEINYYQKFINNLHEVVSKHLKENELKSLQTRINNLQQELN